MTQIQLNMPNIEKLARTVVADVAKDTQKRLDAIHRQYSGKPAAQIERVLKRELDKTPVQYTQATLAQWAAAISGGTRIQLRTS